MANRYGVEDEPGRQSREPESGRRRGGGYGMGGVERGYNQGGYGGYEEGYRRGSYDRLLDRSERHEGYGDEEYGEVRDEDERYGSEPEPYRPAAVGFGRESFSDEWMSFERSKARGPGKGPKGYTRSDTRIHEDVCEHLMHSPYDASDVMVTVNKGEVTLAGTVRSRADKWGIEDVAAAVLGVQDVHNQIRINRDAARDSEPILGGDTGHFHS